MLYTLFILLIRSDLESFSFLRCQAHTFFIFIIVTEFTRIIAVILEERTKEAKREYGLEYWNTFTECLFNLFILYYFVAISKKQNDIDKRVNTNDE